MTACTASQAWGQVRRPLYSNMTATTVRGGSLLGLLCYQPIRATRPSDCLLPLLLHVLGFVFPQYGPPWDCVLLFTNKK